jgi:hypothetical protein
MKPYYFILFLFLLSCESNKKQSVGKQATIIKDSIKASRDFTQPAVEVSRLLTYEQQMKYLSDTIKETTKQGYYNKNYALTIHEFIEDKEEAIQLLKKNKSFAPHMHKAYQIVLTLDGKQVLEKLITKHTFKDSLRDIPLEKYYITKVKYDYVRVNNLYFYAHLRPKDELSNSTKQASFTVSFVIDYLKEIGKFTYRAGYY